MRPWIALMVAYAVAAPAATPVEVHGTLHAQGGTVVGKDGKPASLHGMSLWKAALAANENAFLVFAPFR